MSGLPGVLAGVLCLTILVGVVGGPGVILAVLTRGRWDRGGHGRPMIVAALNASVVAVLLTLISSGLLVLGSMHDDRGAQGLEVMPVCCVGYGVISFLLSFGPLFLLRRRTAGVEPPEVESEAGLDPEVAPERRGRARASLFLALAAYVPAYGSLIAVVAGLKLGGLEPATMRDLITYGLSGGGALAFLLNATALALGVSAALGPRRTTRMKALAWSGVALSVLGAMGSPSLIVLSWLLEGFVRGVGAVH